ncbi:class I SAM-dependent methyltransferase [Ruegeria sp. WL0004]|uniref:Class I SAM-dependent methyltransferase n=1 Tax=Ruegeria marisflavi TaxID=2984152 RepID=A0ABT2WRV0_9RHOB|nr:class I SAM-dependent methyltransferase [Ruegeria sp. WL0004]MCU9838638.1 class I SAM-dependent methyltransferase [Ruegeria sp. WL0004]
MSDPETIRVYQSRASDYADMTDEHNAADPELTAFVANLPQGSHVLDLGCGPGTSAAALVRAGMRVTAMDASAEMVKLAARHPGVTVRQATFDDVVEIAEFDGIWANFSLLHAPRHAFPGHLSALHRALKPGGLFHIALKLGTGEARDALGRFYSYYTEDELETRMQVAGFTIIDRAFGAGPGLSGEVSDWIAVRARA